MLQKEYTIEQMKDVHMRLHYKLIALSITFECLCSQKRKGKVPVKEANNFLNLLEKKGRNYERVYCELSYRLGYYD